MANWMFLIVVLLSGWVGYLGYSQWQFDQLSEALDADIATLHRLRWERAPLRRPSVDGNAADAIYENLEGRKPLSKADREAIAEALHYGNDLPEKQAGILEAWSKTVVRLRMATHRTWSATKLAVSRGEEMRVPDYPLVMDAALVMLAHGAKAGGDTCLGTVADAVRMGQDLVPGGPLEASSVAMRITSIGARVLGFCTKAATGPGLRKAAAEFRRLAIESPPTGVGIEVADLLATVQLREQATLDREASYGEIMGGLQERPEIFKAWKALAQPSRWRGIVPESYPDAVANWRSEQDWREKSGQEGIAEHTKGVLGWLYDDQRGQALLRCMALGLSTLSERERRARTPRNLVGIQDGALRDPFSGAPMHHRVSQNGDELAVWSVGEDMRDDRGTEEWSADTPLDVLVILRMSELEVPTKGRGRRPRAR